MVLSYIINDLQEALLIFLVVARKKACTNLTSIHFIS